MREILPLAGGVGGGIVILNLFQNLKKIIEPVQKT
jgi:hypothetical protein